MSAIDIAKNHLMGAETKPDSGIKKFLKAYAAAQLIDKEDIKKSLSTGAVIFGLLTGGALAYVILRKKRKPISV